MIVEAVQTLRHLNADAIGIMQIHRRPGAPPPTGGNQLIKIEDNVDFGACIPRLRHRF
jgi:hypothetical protein